MKREVAVASKGAGGRRGEGRKYLGEAVEIVGGGATAKVHTDSTRSQLSLPLTYTILLLLSLLLLLLLFVIVVVWAVVFLVAGTIATAATDEVLAINRLLRRPRGTPYEEEDEKAR